MPPQKDVEEHSTLGTFVRDAIIGLSDGLTVPFAIAAGLASVAATTTTIIIAAVLAEIAAGSISMGLGGFLAGRTESEHYMAERKREEWEVDNKREIEKQEVADVLYSYGLSPDEATVVVESLAKRKKDWVDFMMRFELGLEEPDRRQALKSAATIAGGYAAGGIVPLVPYLFIHNVHDALIVSGAVTLLALAVFGYMRGYLIGGAIVRSMWQTVLVGGIAASAAFIIAKLVS